jgi:flagellar assembly factor FliW
MAPIVVNEKLRRGKQVIMLESTYSVRHPMLGSSQCRE